MFFQNILRLSVDEFLNKLYKRRQKAVSAEIVWEIQISQTSQTFSNGIVASYFSVCQNWIGDFLRLVEPGGACSSAVVSDLHSEGPSQVPTKS